MRPLDDMTAMRTKLVTHLKEHGVVLTEMVDHALREVPRHLFLPDADHERAYLTMLSSLSAMRMDRHSLPRHSRRSSQPCWSSFRCLTDTGS
jgi:protein-L-isoaspartate O-methyltransferase